MNRHLTLVIIFTISAALPAIATAQAPSPSAEVENPAVLDVNGEKIYAGDITITMRNIAAQMSGQADAQNQEALAQTAMQQVVEQKLLAQEARRTGVEAHEDRLAAMVQAVERQAGGKEKLETDLATFGMTHEQLTAYLRDMELSRSLIESQILPTIDVSDEEIKSFYEQNPQLFDVAEQVHARHIIFKIGLDADPEAVRETRARAEEARQRALAGEDFAELARELSEGPTASQGGDLGFFTRQQTAPQLANAAFSTDPGGIAPIVRSNFGYHVIKVEEKRPARHLPLDEVSDRVRNMLIQKKTGEKTSELIKKLGEKATIVNLVTDTQVTSQTPPQ
jgi:peptidyl-prolyl cis-trans isomerase C